MATVTHLTDSSISLSAQNWDLVYTIVQANSATTWNYQGTDLKALSANWQGTFTNVQSNSANWNTAFDRSTVFSSVSSRYNGSSTVVESASSIWNSASAAAVDYTHTNFLPLSGGSLTGNLTVTGNVSATGTVYAQEGNSSQWISKTQALAFSIAL